MSRIRNWILNLIKTSYNRIVDLNWYGGNITSIKRVIYTIHLTGQELLPIYKIVKINPLNITLYVQKSLMVKKKH